VFNALKYKRAVTSPFAHYTTHGTSAQLRELERQNLSFRKTTGIVWSRDSSVGIATGYGAGRVPVESRIFFLSSKQVLEPTQPPIQWVPGALSLGVKRQRREADRSPPAIAEVKKMWIYTSTPPKASWRSG
jgi:hypothetical protein